MYRHSQHQPTPDLGPGSAHILEILLFLEKQSEADDGPVDKHTSDDRHRHGRHCNMPRMRKKDRECYRYHNHQPKHPEVTAVAHRSPETETASSELRCTNATKQWERQHTNPHHDEKRRTKPSKIHDSIPRAFHEIIRVRTPSAYPIRQRGEDVGSYDKER